MNKNKNDVVTESIQDVHIQEKRLTACCAWLCGCCCVFGGSFSFWSYAFWTFAFVLLPDVAATEIEQKR